MCVGMKSTIPRNSLKILVFIVDWPTVGWALTEGDAGGRTSG
jgi:hypothetical protein